MSITDFIFEQLLKLKFFKPDHIEIFKIYLDGLIRGHKKSVTGIKKEFNYRFDTKIFLEYLKSFWNYSIQLEDHILQQIAPNLDNRSKTFIIGDDTTHMVYGNKIYGAAIQHDHARNANINSIKLVDIVVLDSKDRIFTNNFDIYLPKKFIEKYKFKGYPFNSKIRILREMIRDIIKKLYLEQVPKNNIWVITDCWYVSENFEESLRDSGVNFVLQLKKDRQIRLFNKWLRIEMYFEKYKKWHYFTYKNEKTKVYYKEAILDVSKFGRRKVFLFREKNSKKNRYYMTNKLDLAAKTAYRYIKKRWSVETMHREVKQFFGLEATYSGRESYLRPHYMVSYYGWLLFQWYKWQKLKSDEKMSTEKLWMQYIIEMNEKEVCINCNCRNSRKVNTRVLQKIKKFKKAKTPLEIKTY